MTWNWLFLLCECYLLGKGWLVFMDCLWEKIGIHVSFTENDNSLKFCPYGCKKNSTTAVVQTCSNSITHLLLLLHCIKYNLHRWIKMHLYLDSKYLFWFHSKLMWEDTLLLYWYIGVLQLMKHISGIWMPHNDKLWHFIYSLGCFRVLLWH